MSLSTETPSKSVLRGFASCETTLKNVVNGGICETAGVLDDSSRNALGVEDLVFQTLHTYKHVAETEKRSRLIWESIFAFQEYR